MFPPHCFIHSFVIVISIKNVRVFVRTHFLMTYSINVEKGNNSINIIRITWRGDKPPVLSGLRASQCLVFLCLTLSIITCLFVFLFSIALSVFFILCFWSTSMLLTRKERCTISPNKQQKLGVVFSARFVTGQGIFAGGRSAIRPRPIPAPLYAYICGVKRNVFIDIIEILINWCQPIKIK